MTRFTAIIFIAFIAICTSTLCAKSIFDDDAPSAPAPVHVKPPMKLEPEDTPAPKPAPAPETPAETPQTPATPGPVAPPLIVDDKAQKEKEAQAKAELDLTTTKAAAEKRANGDPDYVKATAAADDTRKAYEEAKRSGTVEDKSAALSAMSQAITNKETIYKRMMDSDSAYQAAKKNAAKYVTATAVVLPQKEVVSPEIAEAIANHDFIAGMTLRQAKKAARLQCECVHVDGSAKTYRWYVKGRTGTFSTTTERSNGRIIQHQVADFGIVAYVEGNFVDDKLTTFGRYSLIKKPNKANATN